MRLEVNQKTYSGNGSGGLSPPSWSALETGRLCGFATAHVAAKKSLRLPGYASAPSSRAAVSSEKGLGFGTAIIGLARGRQPTVAGTTCASGASTQIRPNGMTTAVAASPFAIAGARRSITFLRTWANAPRTTQSTASTMTATTSRGIAGGPMREHNHEMCGATSVSRSTAKYCQFGNGLIGSGYRHERSTCENYGGGAMMMPLLSRWEAAAAKAPVTPTVSQT